MSNARALQGHLADLKTPSAANVVEEALSQMQTAHVNMWLENEAMKARGDFSTLPSDVLVLRKMLAALYEEIDLLGVERDEKERLQVLLSEKKEQFDFLQASLAVSFSSSSSSSFLSLMANTTESSEATFGSHCWE